MNFSPIVGFNRERLQAIAADGNEFDCDTALSWGLSFEDWLRWADQPDATIKAERWAAGILARFPQKAV